MNELSFFLKEYSLNTFNQLFYLYEKTENSSWFAFDVGKDRYNYICPSIKSITGFEANDYLNRDIVFYLNNVFHPEDFSKIVNSFAPFVLPKLFNKDNKPGIIKKVSFRIKHKDGYWLKVHCRIIKAYKQREDIPDLFIGFISQNMFETVGRKGNSSIITIREKEVLQLIGNGFSSKVIADKLNISETTVISHRKNLIQKLEVNNTAQLIKKAVKANLIE